MRHRKEGRKFHRLRGERISFLKNLMHNLIMQESITTTEARAKEIRSKIEHLITIGKKQNVASLRLLSARLSSKKTAYKLYHEIAPRYNERLGGYTRIQKLGTRRKRDGVALSKISFV